MLRLTLIAVCLLLGCGGTASDNAIGKNPSSLTGQSDQEGWGVNGPWRIDPIPTLVIGEEEGPEYELARVRRALRYPGGYVIVTYLPPAIRLFDGRGRFQRMIGRVGEGPGEFRSPSFLWITDGDTMVVYDFSLRRITSYGLDGEFLQTLRYDAGGSNISGDPKPRVIFDRFSDGSFATTVNSVLPPPEADRDQVVRPTAPVFREILASHTRDVIATVVAPEMAYRPDPSGLPGHWQALPFSHLTGMAVYDTILFLANSDAFRLEEWSFRGQLIATYEKEYEPKPLTSKVWAEELDRRIERFNDRVVSTGNPYGLDIRAELASIRANFRDTERLSVLPVHAGRMLADSDGNVWIRAWTDDRLELSAHWHLFLADSKTFAGPIELPARFRPTAIYTDVVLGVQLDEWDVETVREYRIIKPPEP